MVTLRIDNVTLEVSENTTILAAAKQAGIQIPTLCYFKDLNEIGACRVCVVEVEGEDRLVAACNTKVSDGMVVLTNSPRVREARKVNVELILSEHDCYCPACVRSGNCKLQDVANDLNILDLAYDRAPERNAPDGNFPLIRTASKCIKCMRCVQVCDKVQSLNVWEVKGTGGRTTIGVKGNKKIWDTDCSLCGQCITHCPTGALRERDDTQKVWDALADPDRITVVQIAPAVRSAWAEGLGLSKEEATEKRMVAAVKALGFDYVFDTDFAADLTIMEEGSEFLDRLQNGGVLPLMTSCCPGWVRFLKGQYPELTDNLSSAKSPQGMFGAVAKSYFAEKIGADPHKIFCVSVMPCTAKKHEVAIPALSDACGDPDVDVSLTTRELARMLREDHVDVKHLEEADFDSPLGTATGAGVIFGATGGVMEAALRSAYFLVTGKNPDADAFRDVRGLDGWKEATYDVAGTPVRVAVASGLGNARRLLEAVKAGDVQYDFIEVMACPGGCAGGGGQPICDGEEKAGERGSILYALDKDMPLRFSHDNPEIQALYKEYMEAPLSHKAHHLLHTDHHAWNMP
ncbi:MAG: iron hydrogenase small subunit [Clostridia bacterium]|nr:iron hydrogenase small subunit [Clostridia bacterium]